MDRLATLRIVAVVVALTGCTGEEPRDAQEPLPAALVPAPPLPSPAPSPTGTPAPTTGFVLTVDGEGLRLVDPRTGSARPLPFGTVAADVLGVLERHRGPADQGTSAECDLVQANWADGLGLSFREGRFVGWALDSRTDGAITTMSGIGPGSTRAEIERVYADFDLTETSLGQEFTAGGMSGVLDGAGPDLRVESLWAGEVCVFR